MLDELCDIPRMSQMFWWFSQIGYQKQKQMTTVHRLEKVPTLRPPTLQFIKPWFFWALSDDFLSFFYDIWMIENRLSAFKKKNYESTWIFVMECHHNKKRWGLKRLMPCQCGPNHDPCHSKFWTAMSEVAPHLKLHQSISVCRFSRPSRILCCSLENILDLPALVMFLYVLAW